MGFYFRKSIRVGPLRFNLSKSGVGISAGVRGFRVGSGPRGNYIHMGSHGLYYRATLSPHPSRANRNPSLTPHIQPPTGGAEAAQAVVSAEAQTIVDSSSAELVAEMNAKRALPVFSHYVIGLVITAVIFLVFSQAPSWSIAIVIAAGVVGAFIAAPHDALRRTTVLMYDLDPDAERRYKRLVEACEMAASSELRSQIISHTEIGVAAAKYHAGAVRTIDRKPISIDHAWPNLVKSNVVPPRVHLAGQSLFFFPDKTFIVGTNGVGAVAYANVVARVAPSSFVEEERVPSDAKVLSYTWRYVNKDGSPDRRFKENRQFPVMGYEHLALATDSGLKVILMFSRVGVGEEMARAIQELGAGGQERTPLTQPKIQG